jgi:glucosamine 6-phosphate synthetase-like amidotransferase/phosphosugar isomerase protein
LNDYFGKNDIKGHLDQLLQLHQLQLQVTKVNGDVEGKTIPEIMKTLEIVSKKINDVIGDLNQRDKDTDDLLNQYILKLIENTENELKDWDQKIKDLYREWLP